MNIYDERDGSGRILRIEESVVDKNTVYIEIQDSNGNYKQVRVPGSEVAAALNGISGFTVTYEKPTPPVPPLPHKMGAVVRDTHNGNLYLRVSAGRWNGITSGVTGMSDGDLNVIRSRMEVVNEGYDPR